MRKQNVGFSDVVEVRKFLSVDPDNPVAGLKANLLPQSECMYTTVFVDVLIKNEPISKEINDAHKNQNTHDHVYDDPSQHYNQALPRGLRSKLPWLSRSLQLLLVHALVYHTGNFYVASERKPPDAILGIAFFEFEKREIHHVGHRKQKIKKEIKFLYLDFKHPGGNKMPPFVYDN